MLYIYMYLISESDEIPTAHFAGADLKRIMDVQ